MAALPGTFAYWLKRKREGRFKRQEDARADIKRLTGVDIGASTFAQWESGSRVPSERNRKRATVIEFFGGWPEPITEPMAGTVVDPTVHAVPAAYLERIDALVEQLALDRKLIRDLVDDLRLARAEAAGYADATREIGSQDHGEPGDDPADEPPEDVHPASNHPSQ